MHLKWIIQISIVNNLKQLPVTSCIWSFFFSMEHIGYVLQDNISPIFQWICLDLWVIGHIDLRIPIAIREKHLTRHIWRDPYWKKPSNAEWNSYGTDMKYSSLLCSVKKTNIVCTNKKCKNNCKKWMLLWKKSREIHTNIVTVCSVELACLWLTRECCHIVRKISVKTMLSQKIVLISWVIRCLMWKRL